MEPGKIYIERTSTGKLVSVRKKTHVSSTSHATAQAFPPRVRRLFDLPGPGRNEPCSIARSSGHINTPASAKDPADPHVKHPFMFPLASPSGQSSLAHASSRESQMLSKYQPHQLYNQTYSPNGYSQHISPGYYPWEPPPIGMVLFQGLDPARRTTGDDVKDKCCVCGRTISSNSYCRHPFPPEKLSAPTVCRQCRRDQPPSESECSEGMGRRRQSRSIDVARNRNEIRDEHHIQGSDAEDIRHLVRKGRAKSPGVRSKDEGPNVTDWSDVLEIGREMILGKLRTRICHNDKDVDSFGENVYVIRRSVSPF